MFEVCVGVASIASGMAAVVIMVLAVADRLKQPPQRKEETK